MRPLPAFARIFALPQYAFKDIQKPIGISTYRVTRELPEPLQAEVPSIEDLEGIVEQLLSVTKCSMMGALSGLSYEASSSINRAFGAIA